MSVIIKGITTDRLETLFLHGHEAHPHEVAVMAGELLEHRRCKDCDGEHDKECHTANVPVRRAASASPPVAGSTLHRRRRSAFAFIVGIERSQRIKLQHDMWALCSENRALGGKHWRAVLRRFGMTENEVWPNAPLERSAVADTLRGVVGNSGGEQ